MNNVHRTVYQPLFLSSVFSETTKSSIKNYENGLKTILRYIRDHGELEKTHLNNAMFNKLVGTKYVDVQNVKIEGDNNRFAQCVTVIKINANGLNFLEGST